MQSLSDIDLRLLKVFVSVVECGGFAAAQSELGLSHSTVSNHMAALETRLGYALCKRGRGGFEMTARGIEIYESAKDLFQHLTNFSARASNLKERLSGELMIGSLDATVTDPESPLRRAIRSFNSRKNEVHIVLGCFEPGELERRTLQGRIHVAVGTFQKRIDALVYANLYQERQLLYCAADHPLAACAETADDDDLRESGVCIRGYWGHRHVFDLGTERYSATCFDMESQLTLILSGGYIGFLPAHFARAWVASGQLVAIRPERYTFFCKFQLVYRREALMNHLVKTFIDEVTSAANDDQSAAKPLVRSPVLDSRSPEEREPAASALRVGGKSGR